MDFLHTAAMKVSLVTVVGSYEQDSVETSCNSNGKHHYVTWQRTPALSMEQSAVH